MKKSTPSIMVYGDLAVFPLYLDIQTRMYLVKTKLKSKNVISSSLYNTINSLQLENIVLNGYVMLNTIVIKCMLKNSNRTFKTSFTKVE